MDHILNSTVEMSQAELILQLAKTNVEQENRLKSTELRLGALEDEVKKLSQKAIDATRLCRKRGYPVNKVNIDRFGVVNVYPDFILQELLDDYIRTTQRLNGAIMKPI